MIVAVNQENVSDWLDLVGQVWQPDREKLLADYQAGAFPHEFLYVKNKEAVGVISLSIRHEYVEGAASNPCAYLEGIFVLPGYRQQGIASQLIAFAKDWAKEHQLTQLASDCRWSNVVSQHFHQSLGFQEVSQIRHFILDL